MWPENWFCSYGSQGLQVRYWWTYSWFCQVRFADLTSSLFCCFHSMAILLLLIILSVWSLLIIYCFLFWVLIFIGWVNNLRRNEEVAFKKGLFYFWGQSFHKSGLLYDVFMWPLNWYFLKVLYFFLNCNFFPPGCS